MLYLLKKMNIKLFKDNWRKYYKRGFLTGIIVLCFLCFIDQTLQSPFFFNKIENLGIFIFTLSFILFGSVFCGFISLVILAIMSITTISKK